MALDTIKLKGPLKSTDPKVGGAMTQGYPVFGIVKDNIDPTRAGRIKVLIGDRSPENSDRADNWITVSYMSNFFGVVGSTAGNTGHGSYKSNPSSYGEWHAPPDIGTKVICIFINGDPSYGFYIGCVPEAESLHMVPAIGSSDNIVPNEGEAKGYGGAVRLPVTNINTNNSATVNSPGFNSAPRPVHSYSAAIMNQQGILRDPIRGPISSSASREPASRVGWGVSTPGRPIYEGGFDDASVVNNLDKNKGSALSVIARRGGHSLVMDDGDVIGRDQLVRIRTALGHQILMSDDGQTLMILHSNGQSYIELGKEGTIDMYSTNSVNVRTQGDLNLHADRNININAMENLNIQAKTIHTNSEELTQMKSGQDMKFSTSGKLTGLAAGAIAWAAGGDASMVAGGQSYVNGSKVNLNSGEPGTIPEAVPIIPLVAHTDTLYDKEKGFMASPGKLLTVVSRAPAHAPWANAGQGVDVKVDLGASSQLPPAPPPEIASTTEVAASTSPEPPAVATVASAPEIPPVSGAIDKNTTSAVMGTVATNAATGPLSAATTQGAAIVKTAEGKVAAVGAFAQTATQLATGGVLKPGADVLVNGLVQQGKSITQAFSGAVFAGVAGAQNLTALVKNTTAQATSLVNNLKQAQTALGQVGVLTGKESPVVVAGMVTAVATVGLQSTISAVQQVSGIASNLTGVLNKAVNGAAASAVGAITGGAGGIVGSLANKATNAITNAATGAINNALGGTINKVQNAAGAVTGALGKVAGAVSLVSGTISKVQGAAGAVAGSIGNVQGALSGASNKADQAAGALKAIGQGGAAAALATSVTGGLGGIANSLTSMGTVPSLAGLMDQAKGVAGSAFSAIKDSFVPLEAGVPQNLTQIAADNAAAAAAVADQVANAGSSAIGALGKVSGAAKALGGAAASATGALNKVAGAVGSATGALSKVAGAVGSANNALSSATSTLGKVTGAIGTATNALQSATGALNTVSQLGGKLTSVTNAVANVNNSVASITGEVSNVIGEVSQATDQLTSASSSITSTLNNVSAISNSVSGSIKSAINTTIGGVEHATNAVNAIAGAGATITNGLKSLSNQASAIQAGASASVSSLVASGMNNLPGGLNTAASVMNNATGAINKIPGTGGLKSLIKDAQSAAMNGLNSAVSGALGDLQNKLGGLTSFAAAGLPVGAVAELQSAISSLSSGSPATISLPTVGFNTNNREEVTAQTDSVIGDPGIPSPNLTGAIPQEAVDTLKLKKDAIAAAKQKSDRAFAEWKAEDARFTILFNEFKQAEKDYPAGDARIEISRKRAQDFYAAGYGDLKLAAQTALNEYVTLLG